METVQQQPVSIDEIKKVYDNSTVHCAVVTDPKDNILYASQSFADALGYKMHELNSIEFSILPASQNGPVLENGIDTVVEVPSKKGYIVQKDGSKALVDYESVSVNNSPAGQFTLSRISNLKGYVQYNRMAECKEMLENIIDNLTASIIVIDPSLVIFKNNSTFLNTFELDVADTNDTLLKNLKCSFWQNEDLLFRFKDNYEHQQFDFDMELDWDKGTGENKSFKIVSRLIHKDEGNKGSKILLVITDITEEKANQTGRNQRIRHIMHELRNPLSNLALCVELLADSIKENNQEDSTMFLAKAGNSIQRMKQLISDLNEVKSNQS